MDYQKLVLIGPQQMGSDDRINHLLQDPAKKSLSELDKEMQQVLELDISDHDKVSRYNHILQRYLTYYEKSNRPMTVRIDESEPHSKQTYLSRKFPEQVLRLTPVTFRAKAAEILDRMQESNHVSWDERGQLVIDGRPIEQSNMVDLINDVVRNRKTITPPLGWQEFATGLRTLNIPEEIIGNCEKFRFIRSETSNTVTSSPEINSDSEVFTTPDTTPSRGVRGSRNRLSKGRASLVINWSEFR